MAKKNSAKYWEKRLDEIAQNAMDDTSEKTMRELRKLYNDAMKAVRKEISKLYDELLIDGELSTTALYQYGRWQQLQQTLAIALQRLGLEETAVVTKALEKAYIDAIGKTSTELAAPVAFALVNEKAAAEVVKRQKIGGQHFSSRIWANKDKLLQLLNKEITDVIMLGRSKDKAVKAATDRFGVAFSDADRLVRTEVMHTVNSAQKAAYTNGGYTRYKYLASIDKRTSDICRELNGQYFNFDDAKVGVNYPPMHPRCRSTVVPDLKSRRPQEDKSKNLRSIETNEVIPIGWLDMAKIGREFKNTGTDKLILTGKQSKHIIERHPEAVEYVEKYAKAAIKNPDEILKDSKNANTAIYLKETSEKGRYVALFVKLAEQGDSEHPYNSIITARISSRKNIEKLKRKHKSIYKKD